MARQLNEEHLGLINLTGFVCDEEAVVLERPITPPHLNILGLGKKGDICVCFFHLTHC